MIVRMTSSINVRAFRKIKIKMTRLVCIQLYSTLHPLTVVKILEVYLCISYAHHVLWWDYGIVPDLCEGCVPGRSDENLGLEVARELFNSYSMQLPQSVS